ncbi:MAG TPA: hypothetical protein VFK79_01605 [Xanthobacteraceae bacterium]|nr:hypothetical protein [Xanthobacteraceae bacterium]
MIAIGSLESADRRAKTVEKTNPSLRARPLGFRRVIRAAVFALDEQIINLVLFSVQQDHAALSACELD